MDVQRWRGQLRLVAACVAVAASVSYGIHLWFDKGRQAALKYLLDMHQRLRRELDELRGQVDQMGTIPSQGAFDGTSGQASRNVNNTRPGPTKIIRGSCCEDDGTTQADGVKSDDEEFFEFSEV